MAKLAKPKAKSKPTAPKKPTSRSKTGNAACSEAASNWQLSLRGKAALSPDTYSTLAKCRAMASTQKRADAYGRTGKLSDQGAEALKGRIQKRFDSGLITQKSRNERLNMLLKQRAERGKVEAATNNVEPSQPVKGPMRYQEFIASGRTGNEWDAYAAEQNKLIGLRQAKKVRDDWRSGKSVSGQTVLGWLDIKNVRVSSDMRRFLQHDKTTVSTSGIEGLDAKKYGSKVQNLVGQYIGGRTEQRRQRAEFLLEKRSERQGQLSTPTPPTQPARYSLGGKLAPGRGTHARATVAAALIEGRKKNSIIGEYAGYENAGANPVVSPAASRKDRVKQKKLTAMLNTYERSYAAEWQKPKPPARDEHAHSAALMRSGLTPEGLMLARHISGKVPSMKPGIVVVERKTTEIAKEYGLAAPTQPARYSLGGKLAPGRGTEERKATAAFLVGMRKSGKLKDVSVGRSSILVARDIRKGLNTPEGLTETLVESRTKAFLEFPGEYRKRKGAKLSERMDFRIKHHESIDIIARHALGTKGYQEYARRVEEATRSEIQNQQEYFLSGFDKNRRPVKDAYKLIYPATLSGKPKRKPPTQPSARTPPAKAAAAPPSYTLNVGNANDRSGKLVPGYAARITGTDPKYKLKREFISTRDSRDGGLTVSERGLYESRGPSTSLSAVDRANRPIEREYILIGRKKVRNLVDFQAERAARLMERFRNSRGSLSR